MGSIRWRQRWKLGRLNLGQGSLFLRSHPLLQSCPCCWDGRPPARPLAISATPACRQHVPLLSLHVTEARRAPDLRLQLKTRGYNSQANHFPSHYSTVSSSTRYFSYHFATFQSFAVKQINHLRDLQFGSTYTKLKKTRALLERGQCITRARLTRTGSLWLISCHSLTAI